MAETEFEQKIQDIRLNKEERVQFNGKLSVHEIQSLSSALTENTSLIGLYFSATDLGRHGLQHICEAIKNHPTIKELSIKGGIITCPMRSLGMMFSYNKTIIELSILDSEIARDDLKVLFDIVSNSQVEKFVLLNNRDESANQSVVLEGTIKIIQKNTIRRLHLYIQSLTRWGAIHLGMALRENTSLESFKVDGQRCIVSQGALMPVLEGIKNHPHLLDIDIGRLESEDDYEILTQFLASDQRLSSFGISNDLTPKHLKAAIDALRDNNTLLFFNYQDHFSGTEQEDDLFYQYTKELEERLDINRADTPFRRSP